MRFKKTSLVASALALSGMSLAGFQVLTSLITPDATGALETVSTSGPINVKGAFFQSIGTNGRTCNSCHVSSTAWTISPPELIVRFLTTSGNDPVFAPVDGTNCPSADRSTFFARADASSLLLTKGLIRISLPVPANADFRITNIVDPYHCPETTASQPAMYRRPLPATNLPFLTTVMWDGRESPKGRSLAANLRQQAIDATTGHAQGSVPTDPQLQEIVAAETALFTAQTLDRRAGDLNSQGASGGAVDLSSQNFYVGINDVLGADPTGAAFNNVAMTEFEGWANSYDPQKRSIARGEKLFNTLPITITNVTGLNDQPGLQTVNGFCTTCHDTPNVGNHSVPLAINIGVTDYPALPALDINGLPVYTIQCSNGTLKQTTDPGRALISGKCVDVGKTKGPVLRGLAARAPYFHNGSAATLNDVLDFYNQRFNLNLNAQQKQDLINFLNAL